MADLSAELSRGSIVSYAFQDWRANSGNAKGRVVCVSFRVAQLARGRAPRVPIGAIPVLFVYRLVVEWVLGIELPWGTTVGPGLRLYHGVGLVVNDGSVLGEGVTLRHGVTLGHKGPNGSCPVIEDGVELGASCVVLGGLTVGAGAVVAAGAVVVHDVEAGAVVAGNPAKPLGRRDPVGGEE